MAEELARGLTTRGHDVHVITVFPSRPEGVFRRGFGAGLWARKDTRQYTLLRVRSVSIGEARSSARRILENVSFGFSSALAVLLSRKPELVIVETWPIAASLLVVACCRLRRVPALLYVKDLYPEAIVSAGFIDRAGRLYRTLMWLDGIACRAAARVVIISEGMAHQVVEARKLTPERVEVIPDWLDLAGITPLPDDAAAWRSSHGVEERQFLALFAGTIGHASGALVLAEVAERLLAEAQIRVFCVGDGPLKKELEERKEKSRLVNLVLLPFQPRETVSAMHSAADVCLLPTAAEMGASSVPSKFITYMASGRPVIAMAGAGSDLAVTIEAGGLGWVTPPGDAAAFAGAIKDAAALDRRKLEEMGVSARSVAEGRYSLGAAVERFDHLIERVRRECSEAKA